MKFKMTLLLIAALAAGCTQTDNAVRVLESAGYTNVTLDGYAFFSCSEDDIFKTKFHAKGPTGQAVSGAVCAGLLKGSTIRLD